jgi:hypothetical protein
MTHNTKSARLSRADKLALAKNIVAKAQVLLAGHGKPEKISDHQVTAAQIGGLKIMMITPFSGVKTGHGDFRYQLEMWQDGLGKVFGACWQPKERWANEFECFRLVKGEWLGALFEDQSGRVGA